MPTKKSKKVKKLEPKPRIRRRLMRLWSEAVAIMGGHKCAICGKTKEDGVRLEAHHLEPRQICQSLRYDPRNGILLCTSHHKFGKESAHKGMLWFVTWLQTNRKDQYEYVMNHRLDDIDLNDRDTLANIEMELDKITGRKIKCTK